MDSKKVAMKGRMFETSCFMLSIIFATLRACGEIDWAWYIILIPICVYLGVLLIGCILINISLCQVAMKTIEETKNVGKNNNEHR